VKIRAAVLEEFGRPNDENAYDAAFRTLVQEELDAVAGSPTGELPVTDRFAMARAELRKQGQDARAEGFNAIYGLSRGLVSLWAAHHWLALNVALMVRAVVRALARPEIVSFGADLSIAAMAALRRLIGLDGARSVPRSSVALCSATVPEPREEVELRWPSS
jgi:hypothetical protein